MTVLSKIWAMMLFMVVALPCLSESLKPEAYFVKAWLDPAKAVSNQHVKLYIEVGVDSFFMGSTKFPLPEIDNALVRKTEQAINAATTVNGVLYTTQLWQIDIYPNRPGIIMVPEFDVSFVKSTKVLGELVKQVVSVQSQPLLALISVPESMQGTPGYLVSPNVNITDQWLLPAESTTVEAAAGDIFERVVTISATENDAINIPSFNAIVPKGMSVILAEPRLISANSRSDQTSAIMEQHISYVVEKPGQYELGGEMLSWWDPLNNSRQEQTLAVNNIDAGGVPWQTILILIVTIIIIAGLAFVLRFFLQRRDQVELSIVRSLYSPEADRRLAALYAYADYQQESTQQSVQLREVVAEDRELADSVLTSRYSSNKKADGPSLKITAQLYRQIKSRRSSF